MPNFYSPYQPTYQPNYYQNNIPQQQPQQSPPQIPVQQAQQMQNGGFVSAPNEEFARNFPVGFGNSVNFKDEHAPYIYVKTMGLSQFDNPVFEKYRLVKEEPKTPQNGSEMIEAYKLSYEELKAEIEALKAQIEALKARVNDMNAHKDEGDDQK